MSDIRWDELYSEHGYEGMPAYGQSKTANVLFAVDPDSARRLWELSERLIG